MIIKIFTLNLLIFAPNAIADFGDIVAHSLFQQKVDQLYLEAKNCKPIELDIKFSLDVEDWIKRMPPLPAWSMLAEIEQTAKEANSYAKTIGIKAGNKVTTRDKFRHCLAGCYVAKKLNYESAVLVGWYKELSDASDCSKKTSFENLDYLATVKGAHIGKSKLNCESSCKKGKSY